MTTEKMHPASDAVMHTGHIEPDVAQAQARAAAIAMLGSADCQEMRPSAEVHAEAIAMLSAEVHAEDISMLGQADTSELPRAKLTKSQSKVLKAWFTDHLDLPQGPYPDKGTKRALAEVTGATALQVHNWFLNARRQLRWRSRQSKKETSDCSTKPLYGRASESGEGWGRLQVLLDLAEVKHEQCTSSGGGTGVADSFSSEDNSEVGPDETDDSRSSSPVPPVSLPQKQTPVAPTSNLPKRLLGLSPEKTKMTRHELARPAAHGSVIKSIRPHGTSGAQMLPSLAEALMSEPMEAY